jgi:hypothetical protein
MNINLSIIETNQTIQDSILIALKNHINKAFNVAKSNIINRVKQSVKLAIESEPEYQSLIGGKLRYELGVPDTNLIYSIINIWINNINVNNNPIKIRGSQLIGGFTINMIKSDYSDVLASSAAQIKDSSTGSIIPWLEWLLLRGGDIIVNNYEVQLGPSISSRTGGAIMVSSQKDWRVPPEFAGTSEDNWVYRAITKLDSTISKIIKEEIEKAI